MGIWVKDPADDTLYQFDWSEFLEPGETIASYSTTVDTNLTKLAELATATSVSVRVSGGTDATESLVTCNIVTSLGNTYDTEKMISIVTRQSA